MLDLKKLIENSDHDEVFIVNPYKHSNVITH